MAQYIKYLDFMQESYGNLVPDSEKAEKPIDAKDFDFDDDDKISLPTVTNGSNEKDIMDDIPNIKDFPDDEDVMEEYD